MNILYIAASSGLGHFDTHHTLFDLWKMRFVGQKCTLLLIEDHTLKAQFKVAPVMVKKINKCTEIYWFFSVVFFICIN